MASLRAKVLAKAPLLVLGTVTAASGYAIYYAHHQQKVDKEFMRNGVLRDIRRDRKKRLEQQQQQQREHGEQQSQH